MKDDGEILFVIYAAPLAYNHGVAVLSAILKQHGFKTQIFIADGNLEEFFKVARQKWRAICFSHCIKKDFDLSFPYIEMAIS